MRLLIGCVALALIGCGSNANIPKQVLRINFQTDPPALDPRKGGDMTSAMMHYLLFEGLTRLTPDGPTQPGVAKTIDISDDKLTYTFHLRKTNWSDGSPLTAHDFVYTWKAILNPNFPSFNAHLLFPIKNAKEAKRGHVSLDKVGIYAHDDQTLVVTLQDPTPYFLELTAFTALYPVNKQTAETDNHWAEGSSKQFVGNGPFRLVKWQHCNNLKLERNPHYWDSHKIHLDEVKVSIIENEHTALQLFEKGKLDVLGAGYTHIPCDATDKFKKLGLLKDYPVPATTACTFNLKRSPFNNIHIRKALSLSIDRESIVSNITKLSETPAYSLLHPVLKTWPEQKSNQDISVNELFEKGLRELGLNVKELPVLQLVYSNTDLNHQIAQSLQHQWKEQFGLNVVLAGSESKVYFSKLIHHNFDIGLFAMRAQYIDATSILERFKYLENQKNYPGWFNERFVEILDTQMYASTQQERAQMLQEAEKLVLDEVPIAPIFHWRYSFMHQPFVKNIYISPTGHIVLQWAKIVDEKSKST